MLDLKSLTFSGIGRFIEENTINFNDLDNLIQVCGQNNCTGGSSGAGKSTIFKALNWLMGLDGPSTTVLQSRLTKNPITVSATFDWDGIPLKIERGKKLSIDINGEVVTGSSKLTEEKLSEILGMPRELFSKVLHKRQGEQGFFLNMGPADTGKFLTSCLSLDKEQSKILTLDTRLTILTDQEIALKSAIESNKMALEATGNAISALGSPPWLDIAPEALETLKNIHLAATDTLKLVKESQAKELSDLEKERPTLISTPFDRSKIEQVENEVGTVLAKISNLEKIELDRQSQAKSNIYELQAKVNKLNNDELTRQSDVKNRLSSLKIELIKTQSVVDLGVKAKEEAINLAKELQKIKSSICPTCNQGWINDQCKAKEAQIVAKLQELKKAVVAGNEAQNRATLTNEQIQTLTVESQLRVILEVATINADIEQLKLESQPRSIPEVLELKMKADFKNKELSTFRQEERDHQFKIDTQNTLLVTSHAQKQTELKKNHDLVLKSVQDKEYNARSEYETAKNKILRFEEDKKRFEDSLYALNVQLNGYTIQFENKAKELVQVQEEIELANESKKAIKSYLSCSFEDALDSIGDQATKLIRCIPNMATATIQFEGLKENKDGKIKEEVTCVLSMDGEIGIPIKSLSGGERSSTDLAIDLAVIRFIEERTGKGINLMILDEPFTGLDTTNVLEALEMLKESSLDKRLLLVDHNQTATQIIESEITVIRDGLTSRVEQK